MFFEHAVARRVLGINLCGCGKAVAGLWLWQIRIKKYVAVAVAVADLIDDEIHQCLSSKGGTDDEIDPCLWSKGGTADEIDPFFLWSKGVHQATGSLRPVKTYKIRLMK